MFAIQKKKHPLNSEKAWKSKKKARFLGRFFECGLGGYFRLEKLYK